MYNFRKRRKKSENRKAMVLNDKTDFVVKEAYKATRTNIMFSLPDEKCKIIGVTSAVPLEGKSITCINLAITFAETGKKVLLIDSDLRKPVIAKLIGQSSVPGLSNIIGGFCSCEEVLKCGKYKGLDFILSGNIAPNPAELLASNKMEKFMNSMKLKYDYIIMDTPPVNLVTDTLVISKLVSGMVLVVRQNYSDKVNIAQAVSKLKFAKSKLLGFILNDVKFTDIHKNGNIYCYDKR